MRWFENGVVFSCQWPECTVCCQVEGVPDGTTVALATKEEIEKAAEYLGLPEREFSKFGVAIISKNGKCALYSDEGKCRIYSIRPNYCRAFPFVPERLVSKAAFEGIAYRCLGIGKGKLLTAEEIEALRDSCPNS